MSDINAMKLICRICMCENNNMKSIWDAERFCNKRLKIRTVIATCAAVQVLHDDYLPHKICTECLDNLRKAYDFKNLCHLSDYKLRNGHEMLYLEFDDVFNDKCRICLNENHDVKSIFDLEEISGEPLEIIAIIKKCGYLQISNCDVLPKLICFTCLNKLSETYYFKKLCESTDYNLRNYNYVKPRINIKTEINSEDYFGETTFLNVLDNAIIKEECDIEENMQTEMLAFEEIKCETVSEVIPNEYEENVEDPLIFNNNNKQITYLKTEEISSKNRVINGSSRKKDKEPIKLFECYLCGKKFSLKQYLRQHIKWHSGEKPFKCDSCDGQFTTAGSLKVHKRLHTGERPYKCNVCCKGFIASTNLSRHKRMHTGRRLACDICGKQVADKRVLNYHKLSHESPNPQECDVCGKVFMRPHNLKWHKRKWHTSETIFKCDICDKRFIKYEHLYYHSKIHIAVKSLEEPST